MSASLPLSPAQMISSGPRPKIEATCRAAAHFPARRGITSIIVPWLWITRAASPAFRSASSTLRA